jgi:hypothetical protein
MKRAPVLVRSLLSVMLDQEPVRNTTATSHAPLSPAVDYYAICQAARSCWGVGPA